MASGNKNEDSPSPGSGNAVGDTTPPAAAAVSKGKKGRKATNEPSKSTIAVWTDKDDKVLVETLLKECEEGRQSDSGFKPASWTACAEALKGSEITSGGITKTSTSCHDHWSKVRASRLLLVGYEVLIVQTQLKKDFGIVKKLREQSGFGWDSTTSKVMAPDDVWQKYVAVSHSS
jgi:hypothetical protein